MCWLIAPAAIAACGGGGPSWQVVARVDGDAIVVNASGAITGVRVGAHRIDQSGPTVPSLRVPADEFDVGAATIKIEALRGDKVVATKTVTVDVPASAHQPRLVIDGCATPSDETSTTPPVRPRVSLTLASQHLAAAGAGRPSPSVCKIDATGTAHVGVQATVGAGVTAGGAAVALTEGFGAVPVALWDVLATWPARALFPDVRTEPPLGVSDAALPAGGVAIPIEVKTRRANLTAEVRVAPDASFREDLSTFVTQQLGAGLVARCDGDETAWALRVDDGRTPEHPTTLASPGATMGAVRVIVRGAPAAPRTAGTCGPYQLVAGVRPETVARVEHDLTLTAIDVCTGKPLATATIAAANSPCPISVVTGGPADVWPTLAELEAWAAVAVPTPSTAP
ncbi:MAG: hypothetical protein JNK64_15975 [Myxococcales bacterium]|nr:hypothetical protein [Myxococcales bacterium]